MLWETSSVPANTSTSQISTPYTTSLSGLLRRFGKSINLHLNSGFSPEISRFGFESTLTIVIY